jgi:hypothetical protein
MSRSISFLAIFLITLSSIETFASDKQIKQKEAQSISDLMLIYHGATQRPLWTANQLKPYLYRENSGKTEWLFDGFLFLEIFDSIQKYDYDPGFGHRTAGKEQWEWLLNRYFAQQKGPDALETLLDSLSQKGKTPVRQRQVVLSIPCPVNGFTEWGELNGKKLNFNNPDDQVQAACWFIDEALKKWNAKNYKHIKLNGFYWVHEDAVQSDEAIPFVKKYLETKNYQLLWIPYWGAKGKGEWEKLGFDFAWQQPNYFFETNIPKQRLTDACLFSKEHKMGLEMEFDERVAQPEFRARFYDYVNSFSENKVWEQYSVAYYEGGGVWMQMVNSNDPEMKKMVDTLGNIVVERQKRADKSELIK